GVPGACGCPPLPAPVRDGGRAPASSLRGWRSPRHDGASLARCLRRSTPCQVGTSFARETHSTTATCGRRPGAPIFGEFEPDLAVAFGVVAPILAHFDEQHQVDLGLDGSGDLAARFAADRLDGLAALAEHDLALAFALNVDRLLDPHRAVLE